MQPRSTGRFDQNDLFRALRVLVVQLTQTARLHAQQLGLDESDLPVLDTLDRHGWQSTEELAHRSCSDPATLAAVIPRLENDGWIYTTAAPTVTPSTRTAEAAEGDHQPGRLLVGLRPTAAARLADTLHALDEQLIAVSWDLPTQDRRRLIQVLGDITTALHNINRTPQDPPGRPWACKDAGGFVAETL